MNKSGLLIILLLSIVNITFGQEQYANTLSYSEKEGSPKAELRQVEWIAGHWRGEAFGGIAEEIWTSPLGNSMMGAFKLVVDSKVAFYEIETIVEENGTLILRLKHFHGDLKGWEEKDETVDFRLVKIAKDKVWFDGFTIERVSDDEINMYVLIDNEGIAEEVKFNYKRVKY